MHWMATTLHIHPTHTPHTYTLAFLGWHLTHCRVCAAVAAGGAQYFFTGSAVLMNALGGHAIAMEMMDVMETPKQVRHKLSPHRHQRHIINHET